MAKDGTNPFCNAADGGSMPRKPRNKCEFAKERRGNLLPLASLGRAVGELFFMCRPSF
jgi:hypothetical protein